MSVVRKRRSLVALVASLAAAAACSLTNLDGFSDGDGALDAGDERSPHERPDGGAEGDSADGAPTCPACSGDAGCATGFACAPPLPPDPGWFRVAFAAPGIDVGLSCGNGYGPRIPVKVVADGGLAPASCSCTCGTGTCMVRVAPAGSTCSGGAYQGAPCTPLTGNGATYDFSNEAICPATTNMQVPETFVPEKSYMCSLAAGDECSTRGPCVPAPVAGLSTCIAKNVASDADLTTACPAPLRRVLAAVDQTDSRACTDCACGGTCGPIGFFADSACTSSIGQVSATCSTQTLTGSPWHVKSVPSTTCTPVAGGVPTGMVTLQGGVVICCP